MSMNQLFIDVLPIISVLSDDRRTKPPSFDSSYRDGSNGGSFVLLPLFVAEIIGETSINLQKTIIGKSVSVIGIYLSVSVINKPKPIGFGKYQLPNRKSVSVSVLSITEPNRTDRSPKFNPQKWLKLEYFKIIIIINFLLSVMFIIFLLYINF